MTTSTMDADLVVIGAGPAGLEAALLAARAHLRVRVIDRGRDDASLRRNARANLAEGTIGLDHLPPSALRARAQESLSRHGVSVELGTVTDVARREGGHAVSIEDDAGTREITCRRVLLATGLVDALPALPGLAESWGVTTFSCPYCHGYEVSGGAGARSSSWGVLAHEVGALKMAPLYTRWAASIVLFTDGREPPAELRRAHEGAGLRYETATVRALRCEGENVRAVVLEDDREVAIDALVFRPPRALGALVERLGLAHEHGHLAVDHRTETSMKGVHACGDLTTSPHQIVFAMADGAHAAMAIVSALAFEDTLAR